MQSPHDGPPWTPQRTRALFRLFQTSAPPDFQRQVLERVAQRQHAHVRRRMGRRSPLVWWPGGRAWGGGTLQLHRRWSSRVIAMAGCCGLMLGTSLAWWAARTGPAAPTTPAVLVSRAASPPPSAPGVPAEALRRVEPRGEFGRAENQAAAGRAAGPPEPIDSVWQMQTGQSVDRREASQTGDDPARALLGPAPVPHLTVQKERHPPAPRHRQRLGRPRGAPGKPTRPYTRPSPGQQAPG